MNQQDFSLLVFRLLNSHAFAQVFPLLVLILVPTAFLFLVSHRYTLLRPFSMVLEIISSALPWNWSTGHLSTKSSSEKLRGKPSKKPIRTRAQQLQALAEADSSKDDVEEEGCYPGIVNISGTYCFMDSTLQALASLSYLQPHIDEIHTRAEELDVPTPVVDALRDILHTLNTPTPSHHSIRPLNMINALAHHSKGKNNALFSSREHQDAQELFQLVSEAVKSEALAVHKEGLRDRGLGGLAPPRPIGSSSMAAAKDSEIYKGVFDGLTANRRSCMECGYTEAVMHFAFDNWQLSVPRQAVCRLEDCLADYTRLEVLTDCICRKCSMVATLARLQEEADKLTEATNSKKKRAREARKLVTRVKAALDEGRIEEDIKGVKMEKVFSKASTKQSMVARPPPVLALHLNRSMHFGHYASKNTCRIAFPDVLDLTPFTTSGKLSLSPNSPISQPPPLPPFQRSTTPTPSSYSTPRTLYRLSAVVVHYGQHSFGHYVCYRRKPRPPSDGAKRFAPPTMRCPLECECKHCELYGPIREDDESPSPGSQPGRGQGWLRISDEDVKECGIESVMQEGSGAFMLYYERVKAFQNDVYGNGVSGAQASEETLKAPAGTKAHGSTCSLAVSVIEAAAKAEEERERDKLSASVSLSSSPSRIFEPKIVRSVSAMSALTASQRWVSKSLPAGSLSSSLEAGATISRSMPTESPIAEDMPRTNGIVEDKSTPVGFSEPPPDPTSSSSASLLSSRGEATEPIPSEPIPIPIPLSSTVRRPSSSSIRSHSRSPSPQHSEPLVDLESSQPEPLVSPIRLKAPQPLHLAADISMSPPRTVVDLCA